MSQRFDIKRFGKVLASDLHRCSPVNISTQYGRSSGTMAINLITFALLPVMVDVILGLTNHYASISLSLRATSIVMTTVVTAILAPEIHYGAVNQQGRGIHYAMLPASKLEKYLSMLLMCVVVFPLTVFLGACVMDTLVALVTADFYQGFLWQIDFTKMLGAYAFGPGWWMAHNILVWVMGYLFIAMGFIYGNIRFRKHKTAKTMLCFFAIGFVVSMAGLLFAVMKVSALGIEIDLYDRVMNVTTGTLFGWTFEIGAGMQLLAVILLTWFSWHRLKKMPY